MEHLYNKNGLIFWTQKEIKQRRMFEDYFSDGILLSLQKQNAAFQLIQVEAPILTPREFVNKNYTNEDMFVLNDLRAGAGELVLRPETTMGSYEYAKHLLSGYHDPKFRPPIVVFQHGKSFRNEQDQPTKYMRLKEFYQMEFQIIFSPTTKNDYAPKLYEDILKLFKGIMPGLCIIEPSDRLPDYSEETMDIVNKMVDVNDNEELYDRSMELCSISKRKDFEGYKVIEVAIGTDRCVYCFNFNLEETLKHKKETV